MHYASNQQPGRFGGLREEKFWQQVEDPARGGALPFGDRDVRGGNAGLPPRPRGPWRSETENLGDFEVTVKHSPLEPGTIAHGSLFVTRYATNEPVDAGTVQVAFEAAGGSISDVAVEKSATAGTYTLDMPALTGGEYTLRITLTAGGKTSTATFSGVEVRNDAPAAGAATSWSGFLLTAMFLIVGIGLFAALVYLSVRVAGRRPLGEETVSA